MLAHGAGPAALARALAELTASVTAFRITALRLQRVSGFWALTLASPSPRMDRLAALCVRQLDGFCAPPSEAELMRRRRAGLTPWQDSLLRRWGYPYVMDEFRFHMTLTAKLGGEEGKEVGNILAPLVAPFCTAPLEVDAICLFHQPDRDTRFRLLHRYELAGADAFA